MPNNDIVMGRIKKYDAAQCESMKGDIYQSPRGGYFMIVEVKPSGASVVNGIRRGYDDSWWKTTVRFTLAVGWQSKWKFVLKHGNYNLIR